MSDKEAMIFVDAQNVFHGARNYAEENDVEDYSVDALALREILAEDYDLIRAYWFDSFKPEGHTGSDKKRFFYMLEMSGFTVKDRPLIERDGKWREESLDMDIAMEMVCQGLNDNYEVAILVTGDSDLMSAVRKTKKEGKIVVNAGFKNNTAADLKRAADRHINLESRAEEIQKS